MKNVLSEEFEKFIVSRPGQEFKGITVKPIIKETLSNIEKDSIRAFSIATDGAQGAPGKRIIITNDCEIFVGNVLDGSMSMEEADLLKEKLTLNGFVMRNMGSGNILYIKEGDAAWFDEKIINVNPSQHPVISTKKYWVNIILYRIALEKDKHI